MAIEAPERSPYNMAMHWVEEYFRRYGEATTDDLDAMLVAPAFENDVAPERVGNLNEGRSVDVNAVPIQEVVELGQGHFGSGRKGPDGFVFGVRHHDLDLIDKIHVHQPDIGEKS